VWIVSATTDVVIALAPDGTTKLHQSIGDPARRPERGRRDGRRGVRSCANSRAVARLDPGRRRDGVPAARGRRAIAADVDGRVWVGVQGRVRRSWAAVVAAVAPAVLVWSLTAGATAASPSPAPPAEPCT
jgi:hypothetical protein